MNFQIINPRIKVHKLAFILQCLLAVTLVFCLLLAMEKVAPMDDLLGVVGMSSLAASIFIAFAFCASPVSHAKRMIISYLFAIGFGVGCYELGVYLNMHSELVTETCIFQVVAALAVGLTMFFIILFDAYHPPATGMALGLVVEKWRIATLLVIVLSIVLISVLKYLLRKRLVSMI